jgi:hypothetical protein
MCIAAMLVLRSMEDADSEGVLLGYFPYATMTSEKS